MYRRRERGRKRRKESKAGREASPRGLAAFSPWPSSGQVVLGSGHWAAVEPRQESRMSP